MNLERISVRGENRKMQGKKAKHTEPENVCVKAEILMEECMMKICGQVGRYYRSPGSSSVCDPLHNDTTAQLCNTKSSEKITQL